MVRSELPPFDNIRGWAVEDNKDGDRNWTYGLWQGSIFSKEFPSIIKGEGIVNLKNLN